MPLVGGPQNGVSRGRSPLGVGDGREALQRVAEYIEARVGTDPFGQRQGMQGVHNAEVGTDGAVSNAGLGVKRLVIEDAHSGCLTAGSRCSWN